MPRTKIPKDHKRGKPVEKYLNKGIKEIKNAAAEELANIIGAKASHELKIKLNEK